MNRSNLVAFVIKISMKNYELAVLITLGTPRCKNEKTFSFWHKN